MKKYSLSLLVLACLVSLFGCNNRPFVRPRSEIIQEARSKGIKMPSLDEEKSAFFANDKAQEDRLMEVLKNRASGESHDDNYRLGINDEIEINVFDVPELNQTVRVRESGFVSLPLVGAVKAVGSTESEFNEELVKRLGAFVKQPQVSVFISHFGSQRVAVLGAVKKPAAYPLKKGTNSILELLGQAGGVTEKAGSYVTFIPAEVSGIGADSDAESRARLSMASFKPREVQGKGIEIPLDRILGTGGGIPLEIPVRGGDMVILNEAGQVMVEGEVQKPGSFELGRRMSLLGALAASGGVTYSAKIDEVEVIREVSDNKRARLILDLEKIALGEEPDVPLRTNDIVRIPSATGKHLTASTMEALSRVFNVGVGTSFSVAH